MLTHSGWQHVLTAYSTAAAYFNESIGHLHRFVEPSVVSIIYINKTSHRQDLLVSVTEMGYQLSSGTNSATTVANGCVDEQRCNAITARNCILANGAAGAGGG